MKGMHLYAALFVAGTIVPLASILPWIAENGFDLALFAQTLFANRVSTFFGWDVIISALVTQALIIVEGRRLAMTRLWVPMLACITIGVSCALPLFLWMREGRLVRN